MIMKSILSIMLALSVFACAPDKPASNEAESDASNTEVTITSPEEISFDNAAQLPTTTPPEQPAQVNIPAGEDGVVHHFICEDGCAGGFSENGGNCPVCGKAFAHNTAFHAQQSDQQNTNINANQPVPAPEPAQNANGVWHYTCANGCPGGGGQPGKCGVCGGELAHNAAYHN